GPVELLRRQFGKAVRFRAERVDLVWPATSGSDFAHHTKQVQGGDGVGGGILPEPAEASIDKEAEVVGTGDQPGSAVLVQADRAGQFAGCELRSAGAKPIKTGNRRHRIVDAGRQRTG